MFMIRQRLVISREVVQGNAAIGKCLDIIRLRGKRTLEALQRLVGSPQLMQHGATVDESLGVIRV